MGTAGNVLVGITIGVAGVWVLAAVLEVVARRLRARYPHLDLESEEGASAYMAAKLASGSFSAPDTPELIVYLREMTLSRFHIQRSAKTIEVHLTRGWGFVNHDGETMMFPKPQGEVEEDEDGENVLGEFVLHGTWPKLSDTTFNLYTQAINQWLEQGTPLMVCVAEGLPATVIEEDDQTHWLPFPLG